MDIFEKVRVLGIVPVIKIPDMSLAEPLAQALIDGGLPLIEVTMRNECSIPCINRIKSVFPEMCVGAGTVLTVQQADAAKNAGADFAVAPGFDPIVVKHCIEIDMPFLPGCVTPTEISAGIGLGIKTLKFFPSENLGGVKTMKELNGPFKDVSFVATSGITMNNLADYMACDCVAAVGGSFVAPAAKVLAQDWEGITSLCKKAVSISHGFHLAHIGVNNENAEAAADNAVRFAEIFDMPYKPGNRSDFAGTMLESCKIKFPGTAGHIAIGTHSVERAAAYLIKKGIALREEFTGRDSNGKLTAVYLQEEIAGFAVHLVKTT